MQKDFFLKLKKEDKKVLNLQTPQGFHYDIIYNAHKKFINKQYNDDATLIQELKFKINLIKGEKTNIKITYPEDLVYFNLFKKPIFKSGIGYDIHQIDKKTKKGFLDRSGQRGHPPKLYVRRCFQYLKIRQKRLHNANGPTIA